MVASLSPEDLAVLSQLPTGPQSAEAEPWVPTATIITATQGPVARKQEVLSLGGRLCVCPPPTAPGLGAHPAAPRPAKRWLIEAVNQ